MNISLHRPQSDKCFDCEMFQNEANKVKEAKNVLSLQQICQMVVHQSKAKQANSSYKLDAEKESQLNTKIFSMDLEKSLLIPIIPDVKDCFFTNRLVVFNLTFASLKKKDPTTPAKCIVWHEATSGRDAKNIVDAVYKLLLSERDIKHFIFWADNCSSQNKNWFIFTALVTIVNCLEIDSITMKYLTKGHTHMTADGVHGNIENNIKKQKYIYDFEDFKNCVRTSRKDTIVIEVTKEDILDWNKKKRNVRQKDENDSLRCFLLKDVVEVKFLRGERTLLYKKQFVEEYKVLDFLQKKYSVHELPTNNPPTTSRGIKTVKKHEIISKLVPLMPTNRKQFWINLPENSNSLDLIDQGEVFSTET
ncbi:hypothetical protein MSG28_001888 [Choristoneura fumiferana]|uniref:Uncharacterized protein n=1 Tax=Choristoneura fumiferana TaxID=7141 RepID=A0ACC0JSX8_CHOFU|nr:hypothetical protein MSG28_001888 [Choristoneura fumiferana]